jgi:hypothetical protein
MSDDDVPEDDSLVALRAKAAHSMALAGHMSEGTRARLVQMASDHLERAARLEKEARKKLAAMLPFTSLAQLPTIAPGA